MTNEIPPQIPIGLARGPAQDNIEIRFDLRRSKRGTGSYQVKSSWSMEVTALPHRYKLVRAMELPHVSPVDRQFSSASLFVEEDAFCV